MFINVLVENRLDEEIYGNTIVFYHRTKPQFVRAIADYGFMVSKENIINGRSYGDGVYGLLIPHERSSYGPIMIKSKISSTKVLNLVKDGQFKSRIPIDAQLQKFGIPKEVMTGHNINYQQLPKYVDAVIYSTNTITVYNVSLIRVLAVNPTADGWNNRWIFTVF